MVIDGESITRFGRIGWAGLALNGRITTAIFCYNDVCGKLVGGSVVASVSRHFGHHRRVIRLGLSMRLSVVPYAKVHYQC